MSDPEINRKSYFVDEAGDPVLFDAKGRVLVGSTGCSRFFSVGLLDVEDANALGADLSKLRTDLLADPYFKNVPSMQPEARKTALFPTPPTTSLKCAARCSSYCSGIRFVSLP